MGNKIQHRCVISAGLSQPKGREVTRDGAPIRRPTTVGALDSGIIGSGAWRKGNYAGFSFYQFFWVTLN